MFRGSTAAVIGSRADLVIEVRRVHNEGATLPAPTRIAEKAPHLLWRVGTPIHRNNARFVDHLLKDRDIFWCLHDLKIVVVAAWQFRGPSSDASFRQIAVLRRVGPIESTRPAGGPL